MGADMGASVEVSTIIHPNPDTLHLGEGSFVADSAYVGVENIHLGFAHLGPVYVGAKTCVGNSAVVPPHSRIGSNSLVRWSGIEMHCMYVYHVGS